MTRGALRWPGTGTVSLLAALTTWVSLLSWTGFSERPSGFLVPLFAGCLLVAVVGMLLRTLRLHPAVVCLGQVVVLLLWMDHLWAGSLALGGWLPTSGSFGQMLATLGHSMAVSQQYAAPVPREVVGLFPALILAGAAAAVLVDLLSCGLRRVPLAGLPLLAVYTAPISIVDGGVSWVKFAASALCFLVLLAAEESRRLGHWGRQLSSSLVLDSQATAVSSQSVRASARRIGLTVTGLAVIVPLLVPTLGAGWLARTGNGPGNGNGTVSISNPMVSLRRDLVQGRDMNLVYVTTPDPDPSYLRIAVLDQFDGSAWLPGGRAIPVQQRTEGKLPPPPGLNPTVPRRTYPYQIRIASDFASKWLPAPYPVSWIKAPGDWRYDTTTMDFISAADGQTTAGMHYTLHAVDPAYNVNRMENAPPPPFGLAAKYTRLPKDLPDSVRRLAEQVTAKQTSDFARAVRLQEWFQSDGGFTYSLGRASGDSTEQLVRFLGTGPGSRTGYCQQFAAAMALMGRALGIPSRVAVGFLNPEHVSGNTWVFSSHDLHAWPEMFIDGTGWVRFEPTPSPRVTSLPPYSVAPLGKPGGVSQPIPTPTVAPHNRFNLPPGMKVAPNGGTVSAAGHGHGRLPLTLLLVLLVVVLLAGTPRLLRGWRRRRRWSTARTLPGLAEAAWAELRDVALDLRLGWDDTVSPRARARAVAARFGSADSAEAGSPGRAGHGPLVAPEAAAALDRLVELVEQARFARPRTGARPEQSMVAEVAGDVALCGQALGRGLGRGRRVAARWLPVSLLRGLVRTPTLGTAGVGVDHAT